MGGVAYLSPLEATEAFNGSLLSFGLLSRSS